MNQTNKGWEEKVMNETVNRFLGWKLPENFMPDGGISFEPEFNKEYMAKQGKPPMRHEPTGTNLFDAIQAKEMIRYILGSSLQQTEQRVAKEILEELQSCKEPEGKSFTKDRMERFIKHQYNINE